jgi:hypothetical protein
MDGWHPFFFNFLHRLDRFYISMGAPHLFAPMRWVAPLETQNPSVLPTQAPKCFARAGARPRSAPASRIHELAADRHKLPLELLALPRPGRNLN